MVASFMLQPAQADGPANAQDRTHRKNRQNGGAIKRLHTVILIISFFYFVLIILHVMSGLIKPGWFTPRFQGRSSVQFNKLGSYYRYRVRRMEQTSFQRRVALQVAGSPTVPKRWQHVIFAIRTICNMICSILSRQSKGSVMRTVAKLMSLAAGMTVAPLACAQLAPGWNISWGAQNVPLSPALTAAIALMIGLATYAFMRKRSGQGFIAVLAAVILGAMGVNSDLFAIDYDYTIATQTGSSFVTCNQNSLLIGTAVTGGVTLSKVEANFPLQSVTDSIVTQCAPGVRVTPAQACQLPCPSPS
jgi:hypothetical protein